MAGTVTLSTDLMFPKSILHTGERYQIVRELTFACVGDASNGAIPDTDICSLSGYVYGSPQGWGFWLVETIFGATAPTNEADLFLKTANGADLLSGGGVDAIKAAANSSVWPTISCVPIGSNLTLSVTGQDVHSATYSIKLHLVR